MLYFNINRRKKYVEKLQLKTVSLAFLPHQQNQTSLNIFTGIVLCYHMLISNYIHLLGYYYFIFPHLRMLRFILSHYQGDKYTVSYRVYVTMQLQWTALYTYLYVQKI
jgi:hypothetical protein